MYENWKALTLYEYNWSVVDFEDKRERSSKHYYFRSLQAESLQPFLSQERSKWLCSQGSITLQAL